MTRAEILLWTILRRGQLAGARFRRQHPIGPYIADFACISAKLVIELDGATHWSREQQAYDARRTKYLGRRGWRVVRFLNNDVFAHSDGVWDTIAANLPPSSRAARATPPPQAGEELAPPREN
ncbi:MAG: endonuclease domain-containing protein [Hyphomonadaceae bacterium]|nr:endonuclease domain-containing protein [Hyphomonadaceae bacterium]